MKIVSLSLLGVCAMANIQQNIANGSILLGFLVSMAFLGLTTSMAVDIGDVY